MFTRRVAGVMVALLSLTPGCGDEPTEPPQEFSLTVQDQGTGSGQVRTAAGITPSLDCLAGPTGTPTTLCAAAYASGTAVTLTATPEGSSTFAGWAGDATTCQSAANCTLTMTRPLTLVAQFSAPEARGLSLTVVTSGVDLDPNGYTVTIDDGAPTAVPANGTVTFEELPPSAHVLSLADVDENCAVQEQIPFPFSVTAGVQAEVTLHVTCAFANTLAYILDDTVYITSAEPGAVPRRIGQGYEMLRWSPDGSQLALLDYSAVSLADADGGNVRLLTKELYDMVADAVWSPDGTALLIEMRSIRQNHHVLRLSTTGAVELWGSSEYEPQCQETQAPWNPSWSPDGRHVVVNGGSDGFLVCLRKADGVLERALAPGREATWSPDGSRIAFTHFEYDYELQTAAFSIYTIKPDGTDPRDLTPAASAAPRERRPRWSPNGQELSFMVATTSGTDSTTWDLWIMDGAGGNRRKLAPLGLPFGHQIEWSRDGARLAFRLPSGQLAVIQRDGTGLMPVSPIGEQVTSWGWRP